jgi:NAD(P)-dependent dehydrogenase (short-subunit alcohol dehydrogenase family)
MRAVEREPRTAIVTGAGKRVGAEIARTLLGDGWNVVAHVHHEEDPVPAGAVRVVADLRDRDCADRIFAAAADVGPVTLLVNNAARFAWDGIAEFSNDEFDAHMDVNVRAPILLTQALAARHRSGDDALIVNLLDAKLAALNPDYLSYTLSKQTLAGFTQLSARALARKGIRVNGIAPALMLRSSGQSDANYERMHAHNPLQRGVEPEDVIAAIRYLADAKCVTGQVLVIDSGQQFMGLERDVQFIGEQ